MKGYKKYRIIKIESCKGVGQLFETQKAVFLSFSANILILNFPSPPQLEATGAMGKLSLKLKTKA